MRRTSACDVVCVRAKPDGLGRRDTWNPVQWRTQAAIAAQIKLTFPKKRLNSQPAMKPKLRPVSLRVEARRSLAQFAYGCPDMSAQSLMTHHQ